MIVQFAIRNLMGRGLYTWLNVIVLSFSFVFIIWTQGIYQGLYDQTANNRIREEIRQGHFQVANYDPFDPFGINDAHAPLPPVLQDLISRRHATAVLVRQMNIYPHGRLQTVLVKGIDPLQTTLQFPVQALNNPALDCPVVIGSRMAAKTRLKTGDTLTLRWRDSQGTFDAVDGTIVAVVRTQSPTIDTNQIWVPLAWLQRQQQLPGHATYVVTQHPKPPKLILPVWRFKSQSDFLQDSKNALRLKSASTSILYLLLLLLALIGIFDNQTLAILKRKREIGTMMALGMTEEQVIRLFTLEGAMNTVLACVLALLWGTPILIATAWYGIPMPQVIRNSGNLGVPEVVYPSYTLGLPLFTLLLLFTAVSLVSYWPSRRISELKPTDALKGKAL